MERTVYQAIETLEAKEIKVLYMSGYAEDAIVHHGRLDADAELLQKPFRRADLARAVEEYSAAHQVSFGRSPHFRFGSNTEVSDDHENVRSRGKSGPQLWAAGGLLVARSSRSRFSQAGRPCVGRRP